LDGSTGKIEANLAIFTIGLFDLNVPGQQYQGSHLLKVLEQHF
jgi:hypothetical protein